MSVGTRARSSRCRRSSPEAGEGPFGRSSSTVTRAVARRRIATRRVADADEVAQRSPVWTCMIPGGVSQDSARAVNKVEEDMRVPDEILGEADPDRG